MIVDENGWRIESELRMRKEGSCYSFGAKFEFLKIFFRTRQKLLVKSVETVMRYSLRAS